MKRTDGQCLCTTLSVISDYAITGATPRWICEADELTHLPLVSHIYAPPQCANQLDPGNWNSIASGNGWSPDRRQAINQSHPDLLSITSLGINFSEIRVKNFLFMKMHLNMSSAK